MSSGQHAVALHRGSLRDRKFECLTIVALGVAFGLSAGPAGIGAGLVTATVWYLRGTPYALGVGALMLVVLYPGGIDPVSTGLFGGLFGGLVLASAVQRRVSRRVLAGAVFAPLLLSGLAWGSLAWGSLWLAAVIVLAAVALTGYVFHRLELVRLGLVPDDEAATDPASTTDHP